MRTNISDEELTHAAKLVGKALHDSLPAPEDCKHEFSAAFQQNIEMLKKEAKKKERTSKYLKRTAVAAMLALCCTGVLDSVNPSARAAVLTWVREFYENTIVYRFFGDSQDKQLPKLEINYLPSGYSENSTTETHTSKTVVFTNGDDFLFIDWWLLSDSSALQAQTEGATVILASVNGHDAEIIVPNDSSETTDLLWADDEHGIGLMVSGYLEIEELLNIAESITLN